jgi:hypothetical protein
MGDMTTLFFKDNPRKSKGLKDELVPEISAIDIPSL